MDAKRERVAKVIARAGLCSRREAERLIGQGRVEIDGSVLTSPAVSVGPDNRIAVDGRPIPMPQPPRLWRYHKPRGLITTAHDPQGRETVFDRLPPDMPRVQAIGRLDVNTEGLLLLTNDGELKRRLELPATGWIRRYRVRARGKVDPGRLRALAGGITIDGFAYGAIGARLDRQQGSNAWLTFSLREGKNREVRRVCEHLGLQANRLIRLSFGPFQLGSLPKGALHEVPAKTLREQLGADEGRRQRAGANTRGTRSAAHHAHRRRQA